MSVSRVASRYANPIVELALEKGILEDLKTDMVMFSSLCMENRDLALMLKSPIISHLQKAAVLKAVFSNKVNDFTLQIFNTVTRKNRESLLPDIANEIIRLYNQHHGFENVTVVTTYSLDDKERTLFKELSKSLSGKDPILSEKIDKNLIGGFQLKFADKQLDQSVSGKLNTLKTKFIK